MDFEKYRHLKKLVIQTGNIQEFFHAIGTWPRRYAVVTPKNWTRADYQWFFEKIKGGHNYASLFRNKAA